MDINDWTIIQSLANAFAFVVMCYSMYLTIHMHRKIAENSAIQQASVLIFDAESRIGLDPQLLRFHNISDIDQKLHALGLSSQDFAYLLNSFSAGGVYYRCLHGVDKDSVLCKKSYRYRMMQSEPTRKAWPLLREMLTDSDYKSKLDEIYEEISSQRVDEPCEMRETTSI